MMRRIFTCLGLCLLLTFNIAAQDDPQTPPESTPEPVVEVPRPAPATVIEQDGVVLEVLFDQLPQGRAGLLHIRGDDVTGARLQFREQLVDFFPAGENSFYGFIAADMDQPQRTYEASVLAFTSDGGRVTLSAPVNVVSGGFIQQEFDVPPDRVYLTSPDVERLEFARLDSVINAVSENRLWAGDGFQPPMDSELTSPYGSFRVFNETLPTRHTGWDLQAPVGTPVMAMGAGTVAYAGLMDIRGNYVLIDHGYGVYSGYAHFSQTHVTRGQEVSRGQVIGMTGNTGRSSGPHLHWEIAVNGLWIDSLDFLQMWLPS